MTQREEWVIMAEECLHYFQKITKRYKIIPTEKEINAVCKYLMRQKPTEITGLLKLCGT